MSETLLIQILIQLESIVAELKRMNDMAKKETNRPAGFGPK